MALDQAQTPAAPTPPGTDADIARAVAQKPTVQDENRKLAADELTMISELRGMTAFQWFEEEFIMKPYRQARVKVLAEHLAPGEDPVAIKNRFNGLKAVATSFLEREAHWREKLDKTDPEAKRLRDLLATM